MGSRTLVLLTLGILAVLIVALAALERSAAPDQHAEQLVLYCAAGIKPPVDAVIQEYEQYYADTHGRRIRIEVHYGGSGTLLSQLQVANRGDLYLAGDESYIELAREQGLVQEAIPLAVMKPVIAVAEAQEGRIQSLRDLLGGDFRTAIGVPDGAAVGQATRNALERLGEWEAFEQTVEVTKPTVNDLANDVQIGAVDAAIVWDVTARQYGLAYVSDPALDSELVQVTVGVLSATQKPSAALHFARYLGAPDRGLKHFEQTNYAVVEGDEWAEVPEVNFFSGGVNRRALEPIIETFAQREGVRVNTVFQGCGALNAQMSTISGQDPSMGFPDGYLACDVYYMDPVGEWFDDKAAVSSTRIVIVTAKDNPHGIERLEDLGKPGVRVVVGHPTHCTIGGLTERLFHAEGVYNLIMPNVVEMQPSSGLLVPPVVSGAADASLAYYTDTLPERGRLHTVELDTEYARAVQPYGIARSSRHRQLMQRLYDHIARARETYETLGFGWEFGESIDQFELVAPAGARRAPLAEGSAH